MVFMYNVEKGSSVETLPQTVGTINKTSTFSVAQKRVSEFHFQ